MSDLFLMLSVMVGLCVWCGLLTWKLWQYRCAIIRCQEHIAWMLDYLTTPKAGDKIPRSVRGPRGLA